MTDRTIIINEIMSDIKKFENLKDSEYEIELRLGIKFPDKFSSNITKEFYEIIKNKMDRSASKGVFEKIVTHDEDHFKNNYRITKGSRIIKKDKIYIKDIPMKNNPMDIRFSISKENLVTDQDHLLEQTSTITKNSFIRIKDRITYKYKNWNYDLTEVQTIKNNLKETTYEFELELINNDLNLLESSFQKIDEILKMITIE